MEKPVVLELQQRKDTNGILRGPQRPPGITRLPRYFALRLGSSYLTLNEGPSLTFTALSKDRLATHEIVYNKNDTVAMFRSSNGRFWRRDSNRNIIADKLGVPNSNEKECYFQFVAYKDGSVELKSTVDNAPLAMLDRNALGVDEKSKKEETAFEFTDASDKAVKLPNYVLFKNKDGDYVHIHVERDADVWLQFNTREKHIRGTYAVVPLANGYLALQSVASQKFWRNSPSWIWADVNSLEEAEKNKDCHFEPYKLGDKLVALKSATGNFLQMYTEYWTKSLCCNATNKYGEYVMLTVEDAVSTRSFNNITFLPSLAQVIEGPTAIVAGKSVLVNRGKREDDLTTTVEITDAKITTRKTTTSNTFKVEFSWKFAAEVPSLEAVEAGMKYGYERATEKEVNEKVQTAVQYQTAYTVKDVPPGEKAFVEVQCTRAKFNMPFTYSTKAVRFDGVNVEEFGGVDGIFEAVSVFNIKGVAYSDSLNLASDVTNLVNDVTTLKPVSAVEDSGKLLGDTTRSLVNILGVFGER